MTIKVLIVDDEPINIQLLEEILEYETGFEGRSVTNGMDALALLDEYNPDIIILDIMMPGIDGYEVCQQIKNNKRHKFTKILMLSGKAMVEERLKGYESGADDYITKPFVDDELLAKLKVFSKLKKTEEIDELKTSILQLFSHETKTPLNGILLGSKLILDSPSITPKIEEYAKLIQLSGERIHDLVHRILLLSSLRNNKVLETQTKSVKTYLYEFTKNKASKESKYFLTVNCPKDFSLIIDWKLFHEAFESVVENAIQYSPEGGTVTLAASSNDSLVTINVVDEGSGITNQMKDTIFNELCSYQIDYHTKGASLSLAIAREIMHLHQGDLQVESIQGQGANFIFTFPSTLLS